MALVIILLLLILILGGVGLAVLKLLFWIALILFVVWIIGFFVRGAEGARWYRR
ncbi:MAG: hydrophobic protein [Actinobacteria bacterium]|nr:MAG: hydrophobic protein [Actinomycetota bacterium]